MPTNNTFIMLGLGAAALWFLNRGGSEEDQVDQLAGAAMMASGEGTAPDAPFQAYSAPSNPSFFFNEGGQMAKVSDKNVLAPGKLPYTKPELEFEVEKTNSAVGTSDVSLTTPEFQGTGDWTVETAAIWDNQAKIANANFMPVLAIQDAEGGGIKVLGSNVDISTLSSKEQFRAVNLNKPGLWADTEPETAIGFVSTAEVLGEYVRGFNAYEYSPSAPLTPVIPEEAKTDEDSGQYPGRGNPQELQFRLNRGVPANGTSDVSPINPVFSGATTSVVTASTVWDQPSLLGGIFSQEGGAFGGAAVETGMTSNIKSTVRPEPSVPAWAGGNNWWDEG
jgi:hypothetical protein